MSSNPFQIFQAPNPYAALEKRRDELRQRLSDPPVAHRYEALLKNEWPLADCRLDGVAEDKLNQAIQNHQRASSLLLSKNIVHLGEKIICEVHAKMLSGLSAEAGKIRRTSVPPLVSEHQPADVESLASSLQNLFDWVRADSFSELHPFQQAGLVLLRLLDLHPFHDGNNRTCRVLANFYLLQEGYPPAILRPEEQQQYQQAIEQAFFMDTSTLVGLLAAAVRQSLDVCLEE